jgi:hypothetical protein
METKLSNTGRYETTTPCNSLTEPRKNDLLEATVVLETLNVNSQCLYPFALLLENLQ